MMASDHRQSKHYGARSARAVTATLMFRSNVLRRFFSQEIALRRFYSIRSDCGRRTRRAGANRTVYAVGGQTQE
jgi:hypothetical protein